jgi:hypothetical protein
LIEQLTYHARRIAVSMGSFFSQLELVFHDQLMFYDLYRLSLVWRHDVYLDSHQREVYPLVIEGQGDNGHIQVLSESSGFKPSRTTSDQWFASSL